MAKISDEKILEILEAYQVYGTYAAAAREAGVSASTARKYVLESNGSVAKLDKKVKKDSIPRKLYEGPFPNPASTIFIGLKNFGEVCVLMPDEVEQTINFLKEE